MVVFAGRGVRAAPARRGPGARRDTGGDAPPVRPAVHASARPSSTSHGDVHRRDRGARQRCGVRPVRRRRSLRGGRRARDGVRLDVASRASVACPTTRCSARTGRCSCASLTTTRSSCARSTSPPRSSPRSPCQQVGSSTLFDTTGDGLRGRCRGDPRCVRRTGRGSIDFTARTATKLDAASGRISWATTRCWPSSPQVVGRPSHSRSATVRSVAAARTRGSGGRRRRSSWSVCRRRAESPATARSSTSRAAGGTCCSTRQAPSWQAGHLTREGSSSSATRGYDTTTIDPLLTPQNPVSFGHQLNATISDDGDRIVFVSERGIPHDGVPFVASMASGSPTARLTRPATCTTSWPISPEADSAADRRTCDGPGGRHSPGDPGRRERTPSQAGWSTIGCSLTVTPRRSARGQADRRGAGHQHACRRRPRATPRGATTSPSTASTAPRNT